MTLSLYLVLGSVYFVLSMLVNFITHRNFMAHLVPLWKAQPLRYLGVMSVSLVTALIIWPLSLTIMIAIGIARLVNPELNREIKSINSALNSLKEGDIQ